MKSMMQQNWKYLINGSSKMDARIPNWLHRIFLDMIAFFYLGVASHNQLHIYIILATAGVLTNLEYKSVSKKVGYTFPTCNLLIFPTRRNIQ